MQWLLNDVSGFSAGISLAEFDPNAYYKLVLCPRRLEKPTSRAALAFELTSGAPTQSRYCHATTRP